MSSEPKNQRKRKPKTKMGISIHLCFLNIIQILCFEGIDTNCVEVVPFEGSCSLYSSTSSGASIDQLGASGDQIQYGQPSKIPTQSSGGQDDLSEHFKGINSSRDMKSLLH